MPAALSRLTDGRSTRPQRHRHIPVRWAIVSIGRQRAQLPKRVVGAAGGPWSCLPLEIGPRYSFLGGRRTASRTRRRWGCRRAPAGPDNAQISDKSIAVLPFTDMSEKKDQEVLR